MAIQLAIIIPLTIFIITSLVMRSRIDLSFTDNTIKFFKLDDERYFCKLQLAVKCISSEPIPLKRLRGPGISFPFKIKHTVERIKSDVFLSGDISVPSCATFSTRLPAVLKPDENGLIEVRYIVRKRPNNRIRVWVVTNLRTFWPKFNAVEIKNPENIKW